MISRHAPTRPAGPTGYRNMRGHVVPVPRSPIPVVLVDLAPRGVEDRPESVTVTDAAGNRATMSHAAYLQTCTLAADAEFIR